eukprot:tig00000169_g11910.t1
MKARKTPIGNILALAFINYLTCGCGQYVYQARMYAAVKHQLKRLKDAAPPELQAMLTEQNVAKYQREMIETVERAVENTKGNSADEGFDIFISHVQSTGGDLAQLLYMTIKGARPDLKIFLDVRDGEDVHNLPAVVQRTNCILLILTPGVLNSTWVLKEIVTAKKAGKNFVLVHDQRTFKDFVVDNLGPDVKFDAMGEEQSSVLTTVKDVFTTLSTAWIREFGHLDASFNVILQRVDRALGRGDRGMKSEFITLDAAMSNSMGSKKMQSSTSAPQPIQWNPNESKTTASMGAHAA